jgi:hypothetical protein
MADLTPEERQRIYLEEEARLEARRQLESKNKKSIGNAILRLVVGGIVLVIVLAGIGSMMERHETAEFNKLIPEQRHQETLENCASLLRSWEVKTYSELSVTERRMKSACTEQLAHPDRQVF